MVICSRTYSTRCSLRCRCRGGARSKQRCSWRRTRCRAIPLIVAQSPWLSVTRCKLLSEREPLLIAVDDVQWLDRSSSNVLAFALRRLASNHVLLLLARRPADGVQPPGPEHVLAAERVQRLAVGPLSVGAVHRFLGDESNAGGFVDGDSDGTGADRDVWNGFGVGQEIPTDAVPAPLLAITASPRCELMATPWGVAPMEMLRSTEPKVGLAGLRSIVEMLLQPLLVPRRSARTDHF